VKHRKAKARSEKVNNLKTVVKNRTTPTATNKTVNYVLINWKNSLWLQNLLQTLHELNKTQCKLQWFAQWNTSFSDKFTYCQGDASDLAWNNTPYDQGRRQRGGAVVPGLPIWHRCPISCLFPLLLHTSNTVFLKCGTPFWFLAPPAAKSWRRACLWFSITAECVS